MERILFFLAILFWQFSFAQETANTDSTSTTSNETSADSTDAEPKSKFDKFNEKGEYLFTILPVPLYSYSVDAGNIFGLAKYNLFSLNKNDTISQPSRLAELVTLSTKGRVKVAVSTDLIWGENKNILLGSIIFKKQSEFIFGIGNDVTREDIEEFSSTQFRFINTYYRNFFRKTTYLGIGFDIADYTQLDYDSTSFLAGPEIIGNEPNTNFGITLGVIDDARDNRYNPHEGHFASLRYTWFPEFIGDQYNYGKFELDLRKYFEPWFKHVIAIQATTTYCNGDVPFYDLALMGGDSRMRGYYLGALRDDVLVDGQVEYRLPIWNIFGATAWVGTGRVADEYNDLETGDFWINYGLGLRIMVDSKHQTNLRFDMGFGNEGISGFYINFAEAF